MNIINNYVIKFHCTSKETQVKNKFREYDELNLDPSIVNSSQILFLINSHVTHHYVFKNMSQKNIVTLIKFHL